MRYRRIRVAGGPYFFTQVTAGRRRIFADATHVALFMDCLARVQCSRSFELEAYVILPDHLHMIWRLPEGDDDFSYRWMTIKSTFTRECRRRRDDQNERVWQSRFWEHSIRDDRDYNAHADYIHFNPVKHGLARNPTEWPHSSLARWISEGRYPADWAHDAKPDFPELDWGE